ncbi:MAG: FUSC family protein [Proteobacteria bacterium]|nr:FUSC family protein [Pseudomonadota bacterium]
MLIKRLAALREDWPDALRMVISTVLAAAVSMLCHLPETYWAVLSALIVSRPGAGGSGRAGRSRLIGTVFGSAVAMGVIGARAWHVPEIALLAVAMIPLSLFITAFEEFRTAPVAAVILLSSTSTLVSPFHVALLRLLQITIGSMSSTVVGLSVLPSRGHGRIFRRAASILTRIGAALEGAFDEKRDAAKLDAMHDDIRRDLRDLGVLIVTKRGVTRAQARMVRLLSRLQQDSMFVGRVVGSGVRRTSALKYAQAVHSVCRDLADGMLEPESGALARSREALDAASQALARARHAADAGAADASGGQSGGADAGAADASGGQPGGADAWAADASGGQPGGADAWAAEAVGAGVSAPDTSTQRPMGVGAPALDALDFLLETLGKDLHDLIRVLQGPR